MQLHFPSLRTAIDVLDRPLTAAKLQASHKHKSLPGKPYARTIQLKCPHMTGCNPKQMCVARRCLHGCTFTLHGVHAFM